MGYTKRTTLSLVLVVLSISSTNCAGRHTTHSFTTEPSLSEVTEGGSLEPINRERARHGLQLLQFDDRLNAAAKFHAEDMSQRGYFSHTSPEGETFAQRIAKAGISASTTAENIAQGQSDSAEALHAWLNSPQHRANILNPRFKRVGLGHSAKIWVQTFAD